MTQSKFVMYGVLGMNLIQNRHIYMWDIKGPFRFLDILTFIAKDILVCFASDVRETIISFHWKDLSVKGEFKYAERIWKTRTKAQVYVHLSKKVDKS